MDKYEQLSYEYKYFVIFILWLWKLTFLYESLIFFGEGGVILHKLKASCTKGIVTKVSWEIFKWEEWVCPAYSDLILCRVIYTHSVPWKWALQSGNTAPTKQSKMLNRNSYWMSNGNFPTEASKNSSHATINCINKLGEFIEK